VNPATDKYTQWDAAYVLGALSPADRREFEEHLSSCQACQAAVAELAGLPGLLAQVSPEDAAMLVLEGPGFADEVPPKTLMPPLIAQRRARRRRMVAAIVGIAAALVLIAGAIGIGTGALPIGRPPTPYLLAFHRLQPSAITAIVQVVPQKQGTDFQVECQYGEVNDPTPGGAHEVYAIWVIPRSGAAVEAKTWPANPNKVMRPQAHSPLSVSRIAAVEIRNEAGASLLRADLP
jgi:hypothetical protein